VESSDSRKRGGNRKRIVAVILALSIAVFEVVAIWAAYQPFNLLCNLASIIEIVLLVTAVIYLIRWKGDLGFRFVMLGIMLFFATLQAWNLWGFLTQVD
jgi:hypothetical protein